MTFVLMRWRPGRIGALRMGIEHGGWCVGCCWGLMAALFALGVMSIGWMVLIAALIALEKLLPWKAVANRSVAVLLVALGSRWPSSPTSCRTHPAGLTRGGAGDGSMGMHDRSSGGEPMDDRKRLPRWDERRQERNAGALALGPGGQQSRPRGKYRRRAARGVRRSGWTRWALSGWTRWALMPRARLRRASKIPHLRLNASLTRWV